MVINSCEVKIKIEKSAEKTLKRLKCCFKRNTFGFKKKCFVFKGHLKDMETAKMKRLLVFLAVMAGTAGAMGAVTVLEQPRVSRPRPERMDWIKRRDSLSSTDFKRRYRLSKHAFDKTASSIRPL